MKGLLLTHNGMEDIAAFEVKELIGKKSTKNEACIVFDIKEHQDLFKLCYKSQSAIGIYQLLSEFSHKNIFKELGNYQGISGELGNHRFPVSRKFSEFSRTPKNSKNFFWDFKKNIQKIDFSEWLSKKTTFRIKCRKNYDKEISTPEIEKELGALIIEQVQKKQALRLEQQKIKTYSKNYQTWANKKRKNKAKNEKAQRTNDDRTNIHLPSINHNHRTATSIRLQNHSKLQQTRQ